MSNKQIDNNENKSASPTSQETSGPKKEIVGRSHPIMSLASPTNQETSGPKKEFVGRVNNELDENAGPETASHVEEIGVVSNENKDD